MSDLKFKNINIDGISTVIGQNELHFKDFPQYYNEDVKQMHKLMETIGFDTRFVANKETTTCDLCYEAAKKLLSKLTIEPESINAIISVTQTPDYYTPGNAHILHKKLNMSKNCLALDLELGCSGYVYGLYVASMMISSGLEKVLLVTGDTLLKGINPKDKSEVPLFGDAGSATVISKNNDNKDSYFILRSDGTNYKALYQPAGAYRTPRDETTGIEYTDENGNTRCAEDIYINGFEIFKFTLTEQPKMLKDILTFSNKTKDDIDYFFMHQANKYIVSTLTKNAKIVPEKVPNETFSKYGNLNSASIPCAICNKFPNEVIKNKQIVMQGFGVGLSWGACQLELTETLCLKPETYKGEKDE